MSDQKTLRDEFAMAALNGMNTHPANGDEPEWVANWCYQIADEMMKARGQDE